MTERNQTDRQKALMKKREEIKELYKSLAKTMVMVFVSLFTLVFVAVSWFVQNSSVQSYSGDIEASNTVMYVLGCKGQRSETEEQHLLTRQDGDPLIWGDPQLSLGNIESYTSYVDTTTGNTVNEEIVLYTQAGEFAWRLSEPIRFYPGARGKLEMYVIPKVDGLTSIRLKFDLVPCRAETDSNDKTGAIPIENETLEQLIDGHILLFSSLDDVNGYSNWIGTDHVVTVENNGTALVKDTPYKVTVYWIWPKQYRNLIYDKFSTRGDLFSNTVNNPDYTKLMTYINSHKDNIFFSTEENPVYPEETSDQMTQDAFDKGVLYYNQADEYIGKNAKYIYIRVTGE